jgi:hypothetical protein
VLASRRSRTRRTTRSLLAAVTAPLLLAAVGGPAAAASTTPVRATRADSGSATSSPDPRDNVPVPRAVDVACTGATGWRTAACTRAVLAAIDVGRAREHLRPLVLPAGWGAMAPRRQLLWLVNAERSARGLAPVLGLSTTLDAVASRGASREVDPDVPGRSLDGHELWAWGSDWAVSTGGPLLADFLWMYDDGLGSDNLDCSVATPEGCWGHRHVLLSFRRADPGTVLLLGASQWHTRWQGQVVESDAVVIAERAA